MMARLSPRKLNTAPKVQGRRMTVGARTRTIRTAILSLAALAAVGSSTAHGAPSAEVAKRCLHYAYIVYPYKRPGSVPMSGNRQAYFQGCIGKNGDIPPPTSNAGPASAPSKDAASTD
jgi:hypothetical protein